MEFAVLLTSIALVLVTCAYTVASWRLAKLVKRQLMATDVTIMMSMVENVNNVTFLNDGQKLGIKMKCAEIHLESIEDDSKRRAALGEIIEHLYSHHGITPIQLKKPTTKEGTPNRLE